LFRRNSIVPQADDRAATSSSASFPSLTSGTKAWPSREMLAGSAQAWPMAMLPSR